MIQRQCPHPVVGDKQLRSSPDRTGLEACPELGLMAPENIVKGEDAENHHSARGNRHALLMQRQLNDNYFTDPAIHMWLQSSV